MMMGKNKVPSYANKTPFQNKRFIPATETQPQMFIPRYAAWFPVVMKTVMSFAFIACFHLTTLSDTFTRGRELLHATNT